jgi:hypothetical protein
MATTAVAAARHIFLSEARFHQLTRSGIFDSAKLRGGGFDLDKIREIAFKQLRDELHRRGDQAGGLAEQRTRLTRHKANLAEKAERAANGELTAIDSVVALVNVERSVVKEKLLGMGGKLQGLIGAEHAALVDVEAREVLTELSDANDIARRAARAAVGLGKLHTASVVAVKKEEDDAD